MTVFLNGGFYPGIRLSNSRSNNTVQIERLRKQNDWRIARLIRKRCRARERALEQTILELRDRLQQERRWRREAEEKSRKL